MNEKRILFVVEGESKEKKILEKIIKEIPFLGNHNIFSYNTNIYDLYKKICILYDDEIEEYGLEYIKDLIDTTNVLIDIESSKRNPNQKNINMLNFDFTDIFLIFDFDCHDNNYEDHIIIEMSTIFDNEVERGMLYINYPMVESIYHFKIVDNEDSKFLTRYYDNPTYNVPKRRYKRMVGVDTAGSHINNTAIHQVNSWTNELTKIILLHHLRKILLIFNCIDVTSISVLKKYINRSQDLLIKQIDSKNTQNYIYVVSSFPLILLDRNPSIIVNIQKDLEGYEILNID